MNGDQQEQKKHDIDFSVVPYVSKVPTDGRRIILPTYFDSERKLWQGYIFQNGKIQPIGFSELVTGIYIAREPASNSDVRFGLSELVVQHFGMPSLSDINSRIRDDIFNALASIQKYFIILQHVNQSKQKRHYQIMTTEIEYALTNHRSVYDLLNNIVREVFSRATPPPQQLKESFRVVAQKSEEELRDKYRMPKAMVAFYKAKEKLFFQLREIRDGFIHHGHTPDIVFHFPDGFGVGVDDKKLSKLREYGLWAENRLKPNAIGSLLELFVFLVEDILLAASQLAEALRACFQQLPEPVSPGYQVYFRSALNFHIPQLEKYRSNPWFNPSDILGEQ